MIRSALLLFSTLSLLVRRGLCSVEPLLPAASPWPVVEKRGAFWNRRRTERFLTFSDDATCTFDDGETGTWDCTADAVSIETKQSLSDGRVEQLRYHAMLHRNNFGDRPRLLKGVKSRDRRGPLPASFLRPILASFSSSSSVEGPR